MDNKQEIPAEQTPGEAPKEEKEGGNSNETKTFTQAQLDAILGKKVNEINDKNKSAVEEAVKNAIAEYDRQAKLSAEEKKKELDAKAKADLEAKERDITLREQRIEAKSLLSEKGLPLKAIDKLVDFVVDVNAEKTKANVEGLVEAFNKAVEEGLTNKLKGSPPEDFSSGGSGMQKGGLISHF